MVGKEEGCYGGLGNGCFGGLGKGMLWWARQRDALVG